MTLLLSFVLTTANAQDCVTCKTDCIVGGANATHATFDAATAAGCDCIDLQAPVLNTLEIDRSMTVFSSNGLGAVYENGDDGIEITTTDPVVLSNLSLAGDFAGVGSGINGGQLHLDLLACELDIEKFWIGVQAWGELDMRDSTIRTTRSFGMYIGDDGGLVELDNVELSDIDETAIITAPGAPLPHYDFTDLDVHDTEGLSLGSTHTTMTGGSLHNNTSSCCGAAALRTTGGSITIDGTSFADNSTPAGPGAAWLAGTVLVRNASFTDNAGSDGGALRLTDATIEDSVFLRNTASDDGGAIEVDFGTTTLDRVEIRDCVANDDGGAVYVDGGDVVVIESLFDGNDAYDGGAVYLEGGDATIEGSLIEHNTSTRSGAAFYVYSGRDLSIERSTLHANIASGSGGAVYARGDVDIVNSTLYANSGSKGGALYITSGSDSTLLFSTVVGNTATANYHAALVSSSSTLTAESSVLGTDGGPASGIDCAGTVAATSTFDADGTCGSTSVADFELGPFGGYFKPDPTSPLLGAGTSCVAVDQLSDVRPAVGCDVGSIEQ